MSDIPQLSRANPPGQIDPALYQGLADLRQHCSRDGIALIDRVYRDAQALYKRATDAEATVELYVPKWERPTVGEDLL